MADLSTQIDVTSRRRPAIIGGVVLLLGALLTSWIAQWTRSSNEKLERQRVAAQVEQMPSELVQLIQAYEKGVRGTRGSVLVGGQEHISLPTFQIYARSRDIDDEFPGAQGFGFIRRVPADQAAGFLSEIRRSVSPDFQIHPPISAVGEHDVVTVIEPADRNLATRGLDIAPDPKVLGAATLALQSNRAALTPPIPAPEPQAPDAFRLLLLLPAYRPDLPQDTIAERQLAGFGWAYVDLRGDTVLQRLSARYPGLTLQVSDVTAGLPAAPFFESPRPEPQVGASLGATSTVQLYGRSWRITARPTAQFIADMHVVGPATVLGLGSAVALLTAAFVALLLMYRQRRREQQLRTSGQFRLALEAAPTAMLLIDDAGTIVLVNAQTELLFGFDRAELLGRPVEMLVPPWLLGEAPNRHPLASVSAPGGPGLRSESLGLRKDGVAVPIEIALTRISTPDGDFVVASVSDIKERKQAEDLQLHMTALVESAEDAIITKSLDGIVRSWNSAAERLFGYRAEEMIGKPVLLLLPEDRLDEESMILERIHLGMGVAQLQTVRRRNNGSLVDVSLTVSPIRDRAGAVVGASKIMRDMTEPRRAAEELRSLNVQLEALLSQRSGELQSVQRENEALLKTLNEHALVSVADRHGRIIDVNEGFCAISGYSRTELLGNDHRIVSSGLHPAGFWQRSWELLNQGKPWRGEICNRAKSGSLYWVDSIIAPFLDDAGQVEKYISIRFDVTAQKEAQRRLIESEAFLERVERVSGVGGFMVDLVTRERRWTSQSYRIHDLAEGPAPSDELLSSMMSAAVIAQLEATKRVAIETGQDFTLETPITTASGREIWVRNVGQVEFRDGNPIRLIGTLQDITERRQAEIALRDSEQRLQTVTDNIPGLIAHLDSRLRYRFVNRAYATWFQVDTDALIGKTVREFYGDSGYAGIEGALLKALGGDTVTDERDIVIASGECRHCHVVVVPQCDHDGKVVGLFAIHTDITTRRQAELALREATVMAERANQAKSEFLANMSHEIRTPLNAVIGLGYLLEQTTLSQDQQQLLAKIQLAGRSLLGVINNVLDLSKIEAGEMSLAEEPFALPDLIEELAQLLAPQAEAKGIELRVRCAPEVPRMVTGDATRLRQILTNLLGNAIKFTQVGHVELMVTCASQIAGSMHLNCVVTDTGIGIEDSVLQRLFTPFMQADASTTRRFGGTGLGLSIARRFAELMGGRISVTSTIGVGSSFAVEVPLRLAAAAAPLEDTQALRILIVGSLRALVDETAAMVRALGWSPMVSDAAAELPDVLQRDDGASWPDLVLLFLPLPDGALDRLHEQLRAAAAQERQPPLLLVAEDAAAYIRRQSLLRADDILLARPLNSSTLFNAVNSAVARRPQSRERILQSTQFDQRRAQWLSGVRILVADDSDINRDVARRILERQGALVSTCEDGQQALSLVDVGRDELDIVLMDVQMPVMDGNEATRRIRGTLELKDLPIIALTAEALLSERQRALESGMSDFVTKPFEPEALIRTIRRLVEQARGTAIPITQNDPVIGASADGEAIPASIESSVVRRMYGDDRGLLRSLIGRLLRDFAQFLLPIDVSDDDASARRELQARAHKLKGSAGIVGATQIMHLAGAAESALEQGQSADTIDAILRQLSAALTTLHEEAAAWLAQLEPGSAMRDSASAARALTANDIQSLHALLQAQNLAAMDRFTELALPLESAMGSEGFARLSAAIDNLDFAEGANLLRDLVRDAAAYADGRQSDAS